MGEGARLRSPGSRCARPQPDDHGGSFCSAKRGPARRRKKFGKGPRSWHLPPALVFVSPIPSPRARRMKPSSSRKHRTLVFFPIIRCGSWVVLRITATDSTVSSPLRYRADRPAPLRSHQPHPRWARLTTLQAARTWSGSSRGSRTRDDWWQVMIGAPPALDFFTSHAPSRIHESSGLLDTCSG